MSGLTCHRMPRRAFTLVELLVVIGIIALLISMLLPALNRARRQAQQTAVLGHLHQIGIAMANYESENKGRFPTNLPDDNQDGRAFGGLEMLAGLYQLPVNLFINPQTNDTPSTMKTAEGWPSFAEIDGAPISLTSPASIDPTDINRVAFHCSYAYDHEKKRSGRTKQTRVYLGDRADYAHGRSFSGNWGDRSGKGMCLLFTDQHAEFATSKSMPAQHDPNIYHHNQYYDDAGHFPGEGGDEVDNGVSVTPDTIDTHLRFFSEDEDDLLLPNP